MNKRWYVIAIGLAVVLALGWAGASAAQSTPTATPAPETPAPDNGEEASAASAAEERGILVARVEAGGPAATAGLVRGDILLEVDGEQVDTRLALQDMLRERAPGDTVSLTVQHGDELRTLEVELGDRNGDAYLGIVPCGGFGMAAIAVAPLRSIVVTQVEADSPAEEAGIQEGDQILAVDGKDVDTGQSLADLIAEYEPGDEISLRIRPAGKEDESDVTVRLGEHPDREGVAYLGIRYRAGLDLRIERGEPFQFRFRPFEGRPRVGPCPDCGTAVPGEKLEEFRGDLEEFFGGLPLPRFFRVPDWPDDQSEIELEVLGESL